MKDLLHAVKINVIVTAVLSVLLGMAFIIWPLHIGTIICKVLALLIMAMGAGQIWNDYRAEHNHKVGLVTGLVELLVGIWIFMRPGMITELIPVIIGIIFLIHGIEDARMAFEIRNNGGSSWHAGLIFGVLNLIFAAVLICDSVGVVRVSMQFIGVVLVYDGVSDILVAVKAGRALKRFEQEREAVDTTFTEK